MKDGGMRFIWDGEDLHVLLPGRSCAVSTPCNRLYFPFSWQLNTNNRMDDGLGFIACARGGAQAVTGVINDHVLCLAGQWNCSTICMCSILLLSLGVIGTHGEAPSHTNPLFFFFFCIEVSGSESPSPNRSSYRPALQDSMFQHRLNRNVLLVRFSVTTSHQLKLPFLN